MQTTLSQFFPVGTEYFYSYPAGDHSNFFNSVDPSVEELVAARLLACAGNGMKIVVFAATHTSEEVKQLRCDFGMLDTHENVITLPEAITSEVHGAPRNEMVKTALQTHTTAGQLIMAQPFLDPSLENYYQIDPILSVWLNDKHNMTEYIPASFLAKRFATYTSGQEFATDETTQPLPCVVKVASSSSGDGVYICHDASDFEHAKQRFSAATGMLFVEEYVSAEKNFGIQFAIPHTAEEEIEIIGFNQQITTETGEFMGGMIDPEENHPELPYIYAVLKNDILPKIRHKGWYGVGGFDVLVTKGGTFYFIDSNFRATGMTAYIFMAKNGLIKHSLVSFAATFHGTASNFRKNFLPLTNALLGEQMLHVISLTKKHGLFRINAAMQFEDAAGLQQNAALLLARGLQSTVLKDLSQPQVVDPEHTTLPVLAFGHI